MSQDQTPTGGGPYSSPRPRPGEATKPDHPVMKREGGNALPTTGRPEASPPPSGPGLKMAKTFVVDTDGGAQGLEPPATVHAQQPDDPKAEGAKPKSSLMDLFDDEDMPTYAYDRQPEPFEEESVLLTPDALESADSEPQQAPKPSAPPWSAPAPGTAAPAGPQPLPAPVGQPRQPAKGRSKLPVLIFLMIGGFLVVVAGGVIGAYVVWHSTEPDDAVAPVNDRAAVVSGSGETTTSAERAERAERPTEGVAPQPIEPVPIEPTETTAEPAAPSAVVDAAPAEAEAAAAEPEAPSSVEAGPSPAPETVEETSPEPTQGAPTASDVAGALAPLTDQVLACTRRERGYHPRSLTVHLAAGDDGNTRLRNITPPTPPRVIGCIARLIRDAPVPPLDPDGGAATYTFELR